MNQHEKIVQYHARRCLRSLGRSTMWSLEDLINEGYICLDKAKKGWTPNGGAAFNTYFTWCCINHYRKIIAKARKRGHIVPLTVEPVVDQTLSKIDPTTGEVEMSFPHSAISPDAEKFLSMALHPPKELADVIQLSRGKGMCEAIRTWMGWPKQKVDSIEQQLKAALIC